MILMNNIMLQNTTALNALLEGNEAEALKLLRRNRKTMPCCTTLNNLGVYYCQYGMLLNNGRIRSALKLGYKLLLNASQYDDDWRNLCNIASALIGLNNWQSIYPYLEKASTKITDPLITYNKATYHFRIGAYQKSTELFEIIIKESKGLYITQNCGQHPLLVLAYCAYYLNDQVNSKHYLELYIGSGETDDLFCIFHLRYLLGMYEDAFYFSDQLVRIDTLTYADIIALIEG